MEGCVGFTWKYDLHEGGVRKTERANAGEAKEGRVPSEKKIEMKA